MKKLLFLLLSILLIPGFALAGPQNMGQMAVGFPLDPTGGGSGIALSSATTYAAFGLKTNGSETLDTVSVYYSGTTGTPTAAGSTCGIHTDTSGAPTSSATESKQLSGAPSGAATYTWTGFTTALTANTQYWLVFKNATATPGSNYQTLQYYQNQPSISKTSANNTITGGNSVNGTGTFRYTTDGTNWSSGGNNPIPAFGVKACFSSGRCVGYLFTNGSQESSNTVYAARVWGAKFAIPSTWPTLNVATIGLHIGSAGTKPASGMVYKVFSGSSNTPGAAICTSATLPANNVPGSTGSWTYINFASNCVMAPNQTYRVVAAVQNGSDGSSGNDYRAYRFTLENSASSKAQLPFGGVSKTYSTDGTTFTDTDTEPVPFQLFLDSAGEFTVSGGGAAARSLISGDIN